MIRAEVSLHNAARGELKPIEARAIVDTGAAHLCIGRSVQLQLGLTKAGERQIVLADGRSSVVDYVGPILVQALGRSCYAGAIVMGEGIRLGTMTLADLDLLVDGRIGAVRKHTDSPNIPMSGAVPKRAKVG